MRQIMGFFSGAAAILLIGCDPAVTIHQVESTTGVSINRRVAIHVKTSHPLIGNTRYAPEVKVTNSSASPIVVTKVELAEGKMTYENKPVRLGSYPVTIAPGYTQALDVWIDLNDSVRKIFHTPSELRVHYRSGDREQIVSATIVGGPLDTSVP